jgi:hypothetical protein
MNTKYRFIPIASAVFKILGWVILVVGVVASVFMAVRGGGGNEMWAFGGMIGRVVGGIAGIVYSVIIWVSFLAGAELLKLMVDLERNTRETVEHLRKPAD